MQPASYDAIVVGSGISGGWAAKELTEKGLRVLLLERGRNVEHIKDYVNATKAPWEYLHRGGRTTAMEEAYPVLKRDILNEKNLAFWTNEIISYGVMHSALTLRESMSAPLTSSRWNFNRRAISSIASTKLHTANVPGAPVPLRLSEFLPDTKEIGQGVVVNQSGWEQVLESNKQAFATEFAQRSRFVSAYPTSMSSEQFVDALFANAGVTSSASDRTAVINEFAFAATTADIAARSRALRRVAEYSTLQQQEFNRAFV